MRSPIFYAFFGGLTSLAVALLVGFLLWPSPGGPSGSDAPGGPPGGGFGFGPAPVEVVAAVETIAAEPVMMSGSVSPAREAIVASEVEGVVAAVPIEQGDFVRQGDVLAQLRTTTRELDLAAARANRAEAAARLSRFESELTRLTDLRERRAISEREYEQGIADRDAQAQAVTSFDSETARLEELIARAEITAPFAGQIGEVHAEVGEWTSRGGDVATLVDLSKVEVTIGVPERYVARVEAARVAGIEVIVEFDALPAGYPGLIRAVLPQAVTATRTFPVIVEIDNPTGAIRSGMFARIRAQVGDPVPTVLIPKDSLVLRSGRTFVYRVVEPAAAGEGSDEGAGGRGSGSSVQEIEVELGAGFGVWQVVTAGIADGDLVVVRGNENLRAGAPVVVAGEFAIDPPPTMTTNLPAAGRENTPR